ncbi:MAG: hypothetical protein AAF483_07300 [Planctomycetota bacterium]
MTDDDFIECDDHGEGYTTFVCGHLVRGENHSWHSSEPIDDDEWPSAWCSKCHEHFSAEGEWNEKSEAAADIANIVVILCHHCYEEVRERCKVHFV